MKKARISSILVAVMLLAAGVIAEAQQAAKVVKIGWLSTRSVSSVASTIDFGKRELRAFGYVEGKNITFESRSADDKPNRVPALADELVGLKVDLLVTPSATAVMALKNSTTTIPIVFITQG